MRYALLICTDESSEISPQERSWRAQTSAAFQAGVRTRGALTAAELLQPTETATSVRCWSGGDIDIAHGPATHGNEQISGMLFADCDNLAEAIEMATRVPAAWYGTIEVTPVSDAQAGSGS